VQDPKVLHLVKLILKVGGKKGVPQGGPFSPLAANIYLNCAFRRSRPLVPTHRDHPFRTIATSMA